MPVSRNTKVTMGVAAITLGAGLSIAAAILPYCIFNTTSSANIGLYWLKREVNTDAIPRGAMVAIMPPVWIQDQLAKVVDNYDPDKLWLKTVRAVPGDMVCIHGTDVFVNNEHVAVRTPAMPYSPPLSEGCATIQPDTYFVLNGHQSSFDSRYVGALNRATIQGTVTPLVTWKGKS